jgi:hypothetical protein
MRTLIVLIPARREGSETATRSGDNTRATTDNQHFTCRSQSPAPDSSAPRPQDSGQLTQVDNPAPYKFELAVSAKGAETKHPDLDCTGKLTRVGSSKSYVFFIEIITKGRVDKGGRCPDGTITVARQGDTLVLTWFGSIQGKPIVAYGTLSKK